MNKSIALIAGLLLIIPISGYCQLDSKANEEYVIYFKSGIMEIDLNSWETAEKHIDLNSSYILKGYACLKDGTKNGKFINVAEKRASIVKSLLIEKGISEDKLKIIAFDLKSDCKVVIEKVVITP